jgi:hypothetical protein
MVKLNWSKAKQPRASEQMYPGGRPRRRKSTKIDNWDDLERAVCGEVTGTPFRIVTAEEIESAKSPGGAWTRDTLAKWGVSWPPPKGWKAALLAGVPISQIAPEERKPTPIHAKDSLEAKLLHQVVMAVNNAGKGYLLADLPEVLAYFGGQMPTVEQVIGGRPETAIITGGIAFDDKVYSFQCARIVGR